MKSISNSAERDATASRPAPRVRLQAEVRIQQILDSALLEFSEHGFEGARMDAIAQRCALSKGGLYAHFKGKEQIFEALLTRSIAPPDVQTMALPHPVSVRALAQWLVEQMYASMTDPATLQTIRLLISEGARVPRLVELWGRQVHEPLLAMLGSALRAATPDPARRRSVIFREPWLIMAPLLHTLMAQLVLGEQSAIDLVHMRAVHVELLCELLDPVGSLS